MKCLKIGLVLLVILLLGLFRMAATQPAHAADPCTINLNSNNVAVITCNGIQIGTVQVPTVSVTQTIPPLPATTDIIKLPPVTIGVPQKTVTIRVPQPAKTVTKTVRPHPHLTSLPHQTGPPSKIETRQGPTKRATIGLAIPLSPPQHRAIDLGDGRVTVVEASLGLLATILLIAAFLGTLYAGYILGFREADSKNAKFMKTVLESARQRRTNR